MSELHFPDSSFSIDEDDQCSTLGVIQPDVSPEFGVEQDEDDLDLLEDNQDIFDNLANVLCELEESSDDDTMSVGIIECDLVDDSSSSSNSPIVELVAPKNQRGPSSSSICASIEAIILSDSESDSDEELECVFIKLNGKEPNGSQPKVSCPQTIKPTVQNSKPNQGQRVNSERKGTNFGDLLTDPMIHRMKEISKRIAPNKKKRPLLIDPCAEKTQQSKPKKSAPAKGESSDDGPNSSNRNTIRPEKQPNSAGHFLSSNQIVEKAISSSRETSITGERSFARETIVTLLSVDTQTAMDNEKNRVERIIKQEKIYNQILAEMKEVGNDQRLILDIDLTQKQVRVEVDGTLVKHLKTHQRAGVKFMYNSVIENVDKLTEAGSGCVLAHNMGLGKSLQIISFIHTLLSNPFTNSHLKTVLLVVPVGTLKNWAEEFKKWIVKQNLESFKLYNMLEAPTSLEGRLRVLRKWHKKGGVLLICLSIFSKLLHLEEDSKLSKVTLASIKTYLADPGPDLMIFDEGHLLKASGSKIYKAVAKVKTSRKIISTGTPLQNNLNEYHAMVEVVKPRLLGNRMEFANRFNIPIESGQKKDSDKDEVKMMKIRSAALYATLAGCIQRFGLNVLSPFLQTKFEYTLMIRPSDLMSKMYNYYIDNSSQDLLKDYPILNLICNHPALCQELKFVHSKGPFSSEHKATGADWAKKFVEPDDWRKLELSGKFTLLFKIIENCIAVEDKLIIVSHSLATLDLIEHCLRLLKRVKIRGEEIKLRWKHKVNYFRIDGGVQIDERFEQVNQFNDPDNKDARIFLLSTKAGGVGINLTGANRCVIFDVSWNPSHDNQAIYRIFRMGQLKNCYVYRFVMKDTLEEKIFRKQIVKLGMSFRVLDNEHPQRLFKNSDLVNLYQTRPKEKYNVCHFDVPSDELLARIIAESKSVVLECTAFDSLLQKKESRLTEAKKLEILSRHDVDYRPRFSNTYQSATTSKPPVHTSKPNSIKTNPAGPISQPRLDKRPVINSRPSVPHKDVNTKNSPNIPVRREQSQPKPIPSTSSTPARPGNNHQSRPKIVGVWENEGWRPVSDKRGLNAMSSGPSKEPATRPGHHPQSRPKIVKLL